MIAHKDSLGKDIKVGDHYISMSRSGGYSFIYIGIIAKITSCNATMRVTHQCIGDWRRTPKTKEVSYKKSFHPRSYIPLSREYYVELTSQSYKGST